MTYIITPAVGNWIWQSEDVKTKPNEIIRYPVACWKMNTETGETVGLISKEDCIATAGSMGCSKLSEPPHVAGKYLRLSKG